MITFGVILQWGNPYQPGLNGMTEGFSTLPKLVYKSGTYDGMEIGSSIGL